MSVSSIIERMLDGGRVEWRPLGEVAELKRGTSITISKVKNGDIPVIAGGRSPAYYHNESNRSGQTIVIAGSGAYAGFASWWDQPIFVSDAFSIKPYKSLVPRYCFHWLQSIQKQLHELKSGGGVPHVYPRDVEKFQIPIPCPETPEKSLAIQAEIAKILDQFHELTGKLTAELSAELRARTKQYNHYRDQLLRFQGCDVEWKTLEEIGEFIRGKRFTKADYVDEGIGAIHYGEIYTHYGVYAHETLSEVRSEMADALRFARPNDVVIAGVSETVEDVGKAVAWLGDRDVAIHDDSYAFRHKMNPKFVAYAMQTDDFHDQKVKHVSVGKIKRLLIDGIKKVRLPVPHPDDPERSLAEQARIVGILDEYDRLVRSLRDELPREIELRQKQYEYYRSQLLSFPKPEDA